MRLLVINPVGTEEWNESDKRIYEMFASEGTHIEVVSLERGPRSIENRAAETEVLPLIVRKAVELHEEYDGIIVNCCLDPAVDVIRSLIPTPTVGPCQASLAIASVLGRKTGIVTVSKTAIPLFEELILKYRMEKRVTSIRGIDISVPEISIDENRTIRLLREEIALAISDGVDVIVLGCTGLAGFAEKVQPFFDVPIIDPVASAVKIVEDIVELGGMRGE
ncbi:hydantoin racemase [Thermococcus sp. LS1]|uniref:aspartate/glutamate racemase family protein n=1 Tax=Thermococcus sp. LS1 TaxID=1638259 RepID=UPI00143C9A60|nr:aspartate/glutamate racemase family protein [Thermococcus sp. LS1]NJD98496.1 hydantoin racemase [Thermococcus sp. LS1]